MKEVTKTPTAKQDLLDHAVYIAEDSPDAAYRFLDAAEAGFARILETPMIGHRYRPVLDEIGEIRRWPVPGFPNHLIFYRLTNNGITVLRVLHGARDIDRVAFEGE